MKQIKNRVLSAHLLKGFREGEVPEAKRAWWFRDTLETCSWCAYFGSSRKTGSATIKKKSRLWACNSRLYRIG
jgi:hypothetical protein